MKIKMNVFYLFNPDTEMWIAEDIYSGGYSYETKNFDDAAKFYDIDDVYEYRNNKKWQIFVLKYVDLERINEKAVDDAKHEFEVAQKKLSEVLKNLGSLV